MGIDMVVQSASERRKKMLLADMDSTMIQQECIDELAEEVGVGDRVKEITARAMNGELDFEAALDERVALLADQPADIIDKVLKERIKFMPGARALIATMKADGAYAALVSGDSQPLQTRLQKPLDLMSIMPIHSWWMGIN